MADNVLGLLFEITADPSRAEAALNRLQASTSQSLRKQAGEFDALAQSATAAFNQMAVAAQSTGGVMLRVFDLIAGNILRQIELEQLSVAETAKGQAARAATTIKAIKEVAAVRAIEEAAEGIAALARFQFHKAALHFLSAAKFGVVAAAQVAPLFGAAAGADRVHGPGRGPAGAGADGAPLPPGGTATLAPGAASAAGRPSGNVTVLVMGEPQSAAWLTKVINTGVIQHDLMLVASHTKRSAPAGR